LAAKILSSSPEILLASKESLANKGAYPQFKAKKVKLKVKVKTNLVQTENVLGLIEGSDKKDEIVILTAHYDHLGIENGKIYYGADDDGSGTSGLIEIAQAFAQAKKEGNGPRRSILIMPVTAEEKGLMGSEYYTDHPIFPLDKTVTDLNIDMIGRLDEAHNTNENYVYVIGSDRLSTELHAINEKANQTYTGLELDYTFNATNDPNRFYYRSDHYNFAKNNIPVIFYFSGVHEDYHQPTDTVDKINFNKMEKITRLVFHTAWELANREKKIEVDVK
jgi:Zn-dependent M28 family amino/carboxypeptidase